jgi:hypothetical protein
VSDSATTEPTRSACLSLIHNLHFGSQWNAHPYEIATFLAQSPPSRVLSDLRGSGRRKIVRQVACSVTARPAADPETRQDFVFQSMVDRDRRIQLALLPIVIKAPSSTTD